MVTLDVTQDVALSQMFEYLSLRSLGDMASADYALVFGRQSIKVAEAAARMLPHVRRGFVFTGGVGGKDGGILNRFGIPEACYLAAVANELGVPSEYIHTETDATNGGENCRFGLETILALGQGCSSIIAVAHATSLRRLAETLSTVLEDRGLGSITVHRFPSDHAFDPLNPVDVKEAVAEILRLADWPGKEPDPVKGRWLRPQPGLPTFLVDWARELQPAWAA